MNIVKIAERACIASIITLCLLLAVSFVPLGDYGKKGTSSFLAIDDAGKISPEVQEQITDAARGGESRKIVVVVKASEPIDKEIEKIGGRILNDADSVDKKAKYFAIEADADKVAELAEKKDVIRISPRTVFYAMLDESVPIVKADAFWNEGYTGSGVKIAVLDTGIDKNHPMLSGNVVAERDFSNSGSAGDNHGHGTHVAGIIAGTKSNGGLYDGVAPEAQLINAKVLNDQGEGTIDSIIEGIGWAVDNGADVISMSLGAPSKLNADLDNEIKAAVERGVIVVVSSGNCGEGCPSYNCGSFRGVTMPGNSPNVISVGAVNKNKEVACFSSGENIAGLGIKPDFVAPGVNVKSSIPGNSYQAKDGTSMAAPHVSGAAALLISRNSQLTQNEVKHVFEKTSLDLGELGKDTSYGFGLIDLEKALNYREELEFKIDLERQILVGAVQKIAVKILDDVPVNSVRGTITKPDSTKTELEFIKNSNNEYSYDYSDTSLAGNYITDVAVNYGSAGASSDINTGNSNSDETSTSYYSTAFKAIISLEEVGRIENINIEKEQFLSENLIGSVDFKSEAATELDVSLLLQLLENGSSAQEMRVPSIKVAAGAAATIHFSNEIEAKSGNYTLLIITDYGAGSLANETNISVIDDLEPEIAITSYSQEIYEKSPQTIKAILKEHGSISNVSVNLQTYVPPCDGEFCIELAPTPVANANYTVKILEQAKNENELAITLYNDLSLYGSRFEMWFEACDKSGNCAESEKLQFNTTKCEGKTLLVVKTYEKSSAFEDKANNAADVCIAAINKTTGGTPPAAYLDNFDALVWTTGTDLANINKEDSEAILDYYEKKGRVVVEGSDVAFRHGNDELMRLVLHSELKKELGFTVTSEDGLSNLSINITRKHPVINGLTKQLSFNTTIDPFPDAVQTHNGSVELAEWVGMDTNGSAMVVYESSNGAKKSLLIPFAISALDDASSNRLAENALDWLLEDSNIDLTPLEIRYNSGEYPLIEKDIPQGGYCIMICSPVWELSDDYACNFNACGSPCRIDNITTFVREAECKLAKDYNEGKGGGIIIEGEQFTASAIIGSTENLASPPKVEMVVDGKSASEGDAEEGSSEYPITYKYNFSTTLEAGQHTVNVFANSNFAIRESNYVNNIKEFNLTVYRKDADLLFSGMGYSYNEDAGTATIEVNVSNMGGTEAATSIKVYLDNTEKAQQNLELSPGETKSFSFELELGKGTHSLTAVVDPDNQALEHDESNNELKETLYICNKENVLVVEDNDGKFYSTPSPRSAGEFVSALMKEGYCVSLWDESKQGTPPIEVAETFSAMIWSAGDYFENVTDDADRELLRSYSKSLLLEGSDFAMDIGDGILFENLSGAIFSQDMLMNEMTELVLKDHPITESITSITTDNEKSPYPDGVEAVNAEVVAEWRDGSAAITANQNAERRTAHYAFSADAITDKPVREKLILNTVQWLLESQNRKPVANVTAGPSIIISGITITMNEGETKNFSVVATDPDNDPLIYTWLLNGTIVSTTTEFAFAPGYDDSGTYNLTIIVSDGSLTDSAEFTVTVNNVNRAPVLAPLSNITADENETVSVMPTATDPDGDKIDFTFSQPLDESGTWLTTFNDAGTYTATVTASDGSLNDSGTVNITVHNVNRAPVIQIVLIEPPGSVMNEGETKSFFAAVSDADEDAIKYTWKVNGEVKAVSSPTFLFSTDYDDSGEYMIELIASDSDSASSTYIILTVQDTLSCGNGQTKPCALQAGACSGSFEACSDGVWLGCTTGAYSRNNPAYLDSEYGPFCNDGLDNDCNGKTDLQEEVCASLGESGPKLPPCGNYGDVDGDGTVTEADASLVSSYRAQLAELTAQQRERGDVDGNGEVTIVDAMLIAQYATGRIDAFKTCNQAKTACTDTDGGKDHFAKGTVTAVQDGVVRAGTDSCNSDGTLREWFCGEVVDAAGVFRSENHVPCLNGCNDGACIPS